MKRLIASVFLCITVLCLGACSVPLKTVSARKNGLGSAFEAEVAISLDRLRADGHIKRLGDGLWEIEFASPNTLSGVMLRFSEGNVEASYKGLSFSVPQSAVPVKAMLLNLIRAVDDNARLEELKGEEKDGKMEITGDLEGGEYTLIVDGDGMLSGFRMPGNKLDMTFTELQTADVPQTGETASEASSEEASAAEVSSEG